MKEVGLANFVAPAIKRSGRFARIAVIINMISRGGIQKFITQSKAAIAAGADGLLIEVHNDPEHAKSDGAQALLPAQFTKLMQELKPFAEAMERDI